MNTYYCSQVSFTPLLKCYNANLYSEREIIIFISFQIAKDTVNVYILRSFRLFLLQCYFEVCCSSTLKINILCGFRRLKSINIYRYVTSKKVIFYRRGETRRDKHSSLYGNSSIIFFRIFDGNGIDSRDASRVLGNSRWLSIV